MTTMSPPFQSHRSLPVGRSKPHIDPWLHAIRLLHAALDFEVAGSDPVVPLQRPVPRVPRTNASLILPRPSLTVRVVERLTHCTVAVSWHDATACCYDDQIWRAGVARKKGVCAMTGESVQVGDAIYRPVNNTRPPVNDGAMMLATCVQ
jgi:hypothetical protein